MTRRVWLYAPIFAFITSSCASPRPGEGLKGTGLRFRLSQLLEALPLIRTASELLEQFGRPNASFLFSQDDKSNEFPLNRDPISSWKQAMGFATPSGLLDKLPIGTTIIEYDFTYGHSPDWDGGPLFICADNNDRIVGWMCPMSLQYHSKEALSD